MNHIDLKNKTDFVTGSAGFIGSNLVLELLRSMKGNRSENKNKNSSRSKNKEKS